MELRKIPHQRRWARGTLQACNIPERRALRAHSSASAWRGFPLGMNRNTITAATREMIDDALVDVVMPMTKASWAASSKAAPAGWP